MPQAILWSFPGQWPVVHAPLPSPAASWMSMSPVYLSESHLREWSPERETTCGASHSKLVTGWWGECSPWNEMVMNSHMTPASEMQPLLLLSPQTTQQREQR